MSNKKRIKKTKREITADIVKCCWSEAKHLEDISNSINSNWRTCEQYCNELAKNGILEEIRISKRIAGYKLNQTFKDAVIDSNISKEVLE
jgi:predicted transcriptional regulator